MSRKRLGYVLGAIVLFCAVMWAHHIISDLRLRGEAEIKPLACALYAAKRTGYDQSVTLCKVAIAYADAGDFQRARQIINSIEETVYIAIHYPPPWIRFGVQLEGSLIDKAGAWAAVATLYAQSGDRDNALAAISEALQIAGRIENPYSAVEAFDTVVLKYAELGEDARALQIIDSLTELFESFSEPAAFRHGMLIALAVKYREIGSNDKALGILERAQQTISLIKDTSLNIRSLARTGSEYARMGQRSRAEALLSEAHGRTGELNDETSPDKAMALTDLAEEYARSGDCQRAHDLAGTIAVDFNRSDAQKRVGVICSGREGIAQLTSDQLELESALGLIENGEVEQAIRMMRTLGQKSEMTYDLVEAAARLAMNGKYDLALEAVRAIVSGTYLDDGPSKSSEEYRAEAVALIAIQYERDGHNSGIERRKLLREMLALID